MNPIRYVYVVLALLILGAGATGVLTYRHAIAQAAQIDTLRVDLKALTQNYKTLTAEVVKRDEFNAALRKQRTAIDSKLDEVQRNDPTSAAWLGTGIPCGVRRVYVNDPPGCKPIPTTDTH